MSSPSQLLSRLKEGAQVIVATGVLGLPFGACTDRDPTSTPQVPAQSSVKHEVPPATTEGPAQQTLELQMEIPVLCPAGQGFIKGDEAKLFSPEELVLLNSAFYLWREAVGSKETTGRLKALEILPKLPPLERMDASNEMVIALKAALQGMHNAAAYVEVHTMGPDPQTQEPTEFVYKALQFQVVGLNESYFWLVTGIGHEALHAIQKQEQSRDPHKQLRHNLWKEADAYARGCKDLEIIAKFLDSSDLINPAVRQANRNTWRIDIANCIYQSSFFHYSYNLRYQLSGVATALGEMAKYIERQAGTSESQESFNMLAQEVWQLLEFHPESEVDRGRVEELLERIRTTTASEALLNQGEAKAKTDKFLSSLSKFGEHFENLEAARKRYIDSRRQPQPLPD